MEAARPPNLRDKLPINTVSLPRTLKVSRIMCSYSVELDSLKSISNTPALAVRSWNRNACGILVGKPGADREP